MRGEHPYRIIPIPEDMGSSPHARGTLNINMASAQDYGIIPACAGNTYLPIIVNYFAWDHPRMRGEHSTQTGMIR